MSVHLPKPIERFLSAESALDPDVLAACFAPDGIVRDEGHTRKGLEDIAAWRRETADKYQHTFEPLAVVERDGTTIVVTKVSGSFPGSPITLDFVFRLENGKIASLEIQS
jgi:hypothetical protein